MSTDSRRVSVDAGALQMVRNALQRDADEGKASRGEMLKALEATIGPAGVVVSETAQAVRQAIQTVRQDALQKLRDALGLQDADEVIAMLNASVRIRRLTEELDALRNQ